LYRLSLDQLLDYDPAVEQLQQPIANTSEETQQKIDWSKLWAQQYPILGRYRDEVDCAPYEEALLQLLQRLQSSQHYSAQDAFLVLKDILGQLWTRGQ